MEPKPLTATPPSAASRNVLVIEDERFISELYLRALSKAGYQVVVEPDGAKALEQALTDTFDIILLDLMVPSMTGMDILAQLRGKDGKHIRAKIVITTNLEQREEARAEIERQADAYIVKAEITPRELVEFLDTVR